MSSLKLVVYLTWYLLQSLVLAVPQDDTVTALPAGRENLGGPVAEESNCGGCAVIGDVAVVVWYSQVYVNTAAYRVREVITGNNTRSTRTSMIINTATFSIETDPDEEDSFALTAYTYNSTYNVNGAELYSPTPYNVFTAYTIRSESLLEGSCVTRTLPPVTITTPFTKIQEEASGTISVSLNAEEEQSFIDHLSLSSPCTPGGDNVRPIFVAQVQNITADIIRTQSGGVIASPTRSLARTTNPTITSNIGITTLTETVRTVSVRVSPNVTVPTVPRIRYVQSARIPMIVIGTTTTITPAPKPLPLPILNDTNVIPGGGDISSLTVEIIVPTGGGGNITSVAVVPFISKGNTWRKPGTSWVELSVAGAVGLCCAVLLYL